MQARRRAQRLLRAVPWTTRDRKSLRNRPSCCFRSDHARRRRTWTWWPVHGNARARGPILDLRAPSAFHWVLGDPLDHTISTTPIPSLHHTTPPSLASRVIPPFLLFLFVSSISFCCVLHPYRTKRPSISWLPVCTVVPANQGFSLYCTVSSFCAEGESPKVNHLFMGNNLKGVSYKSKQTIVAALSPPRMSRLACLRMTGRLYINFCVPWRHLSSAYSCTCS